MARGGALRGLVTAWLGLIALHAIGSKEGSGRIGEFAGDVNRLLVRLLDPSVPAIPNLQAGESWGAPGTAEQAAAERRKQAGREWGALFDALENPLNLVDRPPVVVPPGR